MKIFIAYGDANCAYSLKRIGRQACKLGIFDEIILYSPESLPEYIKQSPLMQYSYGGGFWAWKPCIIKETLKKYGDDAVVCYVDAGCTLKPSSEWTLYFELMKEYDFLCFKYRDTMPEWEKFGTTSTKIKYWGKKKSLEFFDALTGSEEWRDKNKIWGGLIFAKGAENPIVNDWLDIVLSHPEIIQHPMTSEEMADQFPYFAQHKHDQVLLVALAYKYSDRCIVLPELSETAGDNVAIRTTRIRCKSFKEYIVLCTKNIIRKIIGGDKFLMYP